MGWKGKKPSSFSLDVSKAAEDHVKHIVMDTVQSLVNLSPSILVHTVLHIWFRLDLVTMAYVDLKLTQFKMPLFKP
ncbi:hypothetical protein BANRA_00244 [Acinetobacter baumannii]|nr:hypothetical protein BANRA_00244 [Acinetobacter baumannii]